MKKIYTYWLLLAVFVGCKSSNDGVAVTSCNSYYSFNYSFATSGGLLHAGHSFFSLADPSNPLPQRSDVFPEDSVFSNGAAWYVVREDKILTDSASGQSSGSSLTSLGGMARHFAVYNGVMYILRHTTYPGSNNFCQQLVDSVNELDVEKFMSGSVLSHISLNDPQDIAILGKTLFVLDGSSGLKVYSIADSLHPSLISNVTSVQGYHMTLSDAQTLLVHTFEGIKQYDISQVTNPTLVSTIQ